MTSLADLMKFKDYHLIEDGLYLGNWNAVTFPSVMKELNIKVVVTAMHLPLLNDEKFDGIEYHFIQVEDLYNEDILSHFPFAYKIISKAQQEGRNVYVHCHAGISRSATIVTSFLMKKYHISADMVRKSRSKVDPNDGFMDQLQLYEKWGYELDARNKDYRKLVVNYLIHKLKYLHFYETLSGKSLKESTITNYLGKIKQIDSKLNESDKGNKYICKNCKSLLFRSINLIQNTEVNNNNCDKFFIEPQAWMLDQIKSFEKFDEESTIQCFKCENKIGNFSLSTFICDCSLHKGLKSYSAVKILRNSAIEEPFETF